MFSSWPTSALVVGVNSGSGRASLSLHAGGHADAEEAAGLLVLGPGGAGEVAAHDALDVEALGLLDDHRAPSQLRRQGEGQVVGGGAVGEADEVIGDDVARAVEPEGGHLGEDGALVRDAVGQDRVEGGDAVGRDHQEAAVAEVVGVAHLAAVEEVGEVGLGELPSCWVDVSFGLAGLEVKVRQSDGDGEVGQGEGAENRRDEDVDLDPARYDTQHHDVGSEYEDGGREDAPKVRHQLLGQGRRSGQRGRAASPVQHHGLRYVEPAHDEHRQPGGRRW